MRSFNQFPYIVVVSLVSVVTSACGSTASSPPGPAGSAGFVDNGAGGGVVAMGSGGAVQNSSGGAVQNSSGGAVTTGAGGAVTTGAGGAVTTGAGGAVTTGAGGGAAVDPQCVTNVTSQTTAAQKTLPAGCAECICGSCGSDVSAINSDDKAKALLTCSLQKGCTGDCCLCGAVCDQTAGANFGNGPCAAEVMTAAGVSGTASPQTAIIFGGPVKTACTMPAAPTSCSKPQDLSNCVAMNCATQCPGVVTACK
jgi:hypothetical protein